MALRIRVLGGLQVIRDGAPLTWASAQPVRSALLVYLALEPEVRREQVIRLLWPDDEPERSRHTLRQVLYLLRQALGEAALVQEQDVLLLGQPVAVDAREFETALEQRDFALAASLYRGAFLKDVTLCESREFAAWVDQQRAKYARLHRRACRGLIDGLAAGQQLGEAVETARAWAALEPFDDEAQHRLIELLAASGQRSEALGQYGVYEKLLTAEGLEPLDETRALVAQLRAADPVSLGAVQPSPVLSPSTRAPQGPAPSASASAIAIDVPPPDTFAALARELRPDLELVRPLGEGRSGRVFLARESHLDRLVAVKVLAPALAGDWVANARFEREARAAAAFNHPNAVAVYRFGYLSTGVPYLVMQYVKGVTLEDRIATGGLPPVAEAREVLAQIADALAAAHRSGFVHRDLRPANVLCDEATGHVLVSDFGLAGLLPEARRPEERITGLGEVLGAPEYASPEQLRGEDVSEACDVYALGVIGYRLIAGESPFLAHRGSARLADQLLRPPRPLRSLRPDVDPALAELLERCLARDPLQRPRAGLLAQALRNPQLAGSASGSAEVLAVSRLVATVRASRLAKVALGCLLVGLAAAALLTC